MRRHLTHFLQFFVLAFFLSGCSIRTNLTTWAVKPLIESTFISILSEPDPELARSAISTNLKILDALILNNPDDKDLLTRAAQSYSGYALMFVEDVDPIRASDFYTRALEYGLRALAVRYPDFVKKPLSFQAFKKACNSLRAEDIEAVYWTAAAWAGRLNLKKSSPKAVAEFPRVKHLMRWVYERDRSFFYGGASWFLGTYNSILSPMLGGDPEISKKFFTEALEISEGRFLLGRVYYAQYYAVQVQDKQLFISILNEVINTQPLINDDIALLNNIAKIKAAKLLEKVDAFF